MVNIILADYTFLINRAVGRRQSNFSFVTQQLGRLQAYKTDGSANNFEFITLSGTETEALGGFFIFYGNLPREILLAGPIL